MIVVTADEIQDSGILSGLSSDDISSDAGETSRLKYLLWPIVKLMTLLRFWRRPKDGESDEEFDKSEASQCNTDTSMEQKGKALQFSCVYVSKSFICQGLSQYMLFSIDHLIFHILGKFLCSND